MSPALDRRWPGMWRAEALKGLVGPMDRGQQSESGSERQIFSSLICNEAPHLSHMGPALLTQNRHHNPRCEAERDVARWHSALGELSAPCYYYMLAAKCLGLREDPSTFLLPPSDKHPRWARSHERRQWICLPTLWVGLRCKEKPRLARVSRFRLTEL